MNQYSSNHKTDTLAKYSGARIVVVDDEAEMAALLGDVLSEEGYSPSVFVSATEAIAFMESSPPDLVITDFKMSDMDGMQLLETSKGLYPDIPVILITAFGTIDLAIEATRRGAFHLVTKPFRMKEALLVVERALEHRTIQQENSRLRREVERRYQFGEIIGKSVAMQRIFELVERVATTNSNVLILGESGTGKELVARAIHYNSPRKNRPFIGVNCSALPEGLLESELFGHVRGAFTGAHRDKKGLFQEAIDGTLFLDEIADMEIALQAKLLRALQEKKIRPVGGSREIPVNVRIVAATNQDLKARVKDRTFREDLYYRLSVIPICLPALRNRTEDIPLLTEHFLDRLARDQGGSHKSISTSAMRRLLSHSWDGNVRQLENVLERAHILSSAPTIGLQEVTEYLYDQNNDSHSILPTEDDLPTIAELEKRYVKKVLGITGGNKEVAAKILGINRRTLFRWRKRHDLDTDSMQ